MKKFIAASLLTATVMCAKAQVYVQGGLNLSNITKTKSGQTEKNNWRREWESWHQLRETPIDTGLFSGTRITPTI